MTIRTLSELTETGNRLETRFKELAGDTRSPTFLTLVTDLHLWLKDCVEQGSYLPAGTPERRTLQGQVDYWTSRLLRAGHSFDDIDRIAAFDLSAGRALPYKLFPYHGLLAVTEVGHALFFGREDQTLEYVRHLEKHPALLIQSESGGGKSSVAMAGVLPELRRRHPDWLVLPRVTPGTLPADTLHGALAELLALSTGTAVSAEAAALHIALAGRTLLVYVDQLEELLTMCADVRQQSTFSELLAELAKTGDLRLLATLRVDHYERLAHSASCHALFALLSQDGSVKTLPPMSLAQIRSVIQKPAQAVGLRFVPASIVETLASESANAPSGLPLLQFALQRLWDERPLNDEGEPIDLITQETYDRLPTLRDALSSVADSYYDKVQKDDLVNACERLMLELTVIDERLEVPLRRRRAERELIAVLVNAGLASKQQAFELIEGFVTRKLIVRTGDGDGRQIEVAHEALFRNWRRFGDWIKSDEVRTTLRETREITRDALIWEQGERSPDLLKLRGVPLEHAIGHRDSHWLDSLANAYVDACDTAAVAQKERDENARLALNEADKARMRRSREVGFSILFILAIVGSAAFTIYKQETEATVRASEERFKGAAETVVSLHRNIKTLDALDLAYSLHQSSGFLTPLAHAVDRLADDVLFGERKAGGADFTPSGKAATQLIRSGGEQVDQAIILPLGDGRSHWSKPVSIRFDREPQERLAGLDVGPRIEGAKDERLVVATFVQGADVSGAASSATPELTRMVVYRIRDGSADVKMVAKRPYPKGISQASEIAFDNSGLGTAVAVWQVRDQSLLAAEVFRWGTPEVVDPERRPGTTPKGGPIVTAVAFGGLDSNTLLKGLSDGTVDCGAGLPIRGQDASPVVLLRAAAGASHYVALHATNRLSIGDCSRRVTTPQENGLIRPRNLVVRSIGNSGKSVLSYTAKGKLTCFFIDKNGIGKNCWAQGLVVDQAVPVADEQGQRIVYHALPDSATPLLAFLDAGASGQTGGLKLARGLPTARPPTSEDPMPMAASPNGTHAVAIQVVRNENKYDVIRPSADEKSNQHVTVSNPELVAINDRGISVVLAREGGKSTPQSLVWVAPDGVTGAVPIKMEFDATCMKMSPDGSRLLLSSERWDTKLVAIDQTGSQVLASVSGANRRGAGVSACAISNDGKTILLGSRDGDVLRSGPDTEGLVPVSQLVGFNLGGAAIDVSIDGGSRFVALLGESLLGSCLNGMTGHPLRIWDLKGKRPDFPVASTCLSGNVRAIGALEATPQGWVLPIFELRDGKLDRSDYPCIACAIADGQATLAKNLVDVARKFQGTVLPPERIKALYGFSP